MGENREVKRDISTLILENHNLGGVKNEPE